MLILAKEKEMKKTKKAFREYLNSICKDYRHSEPSKRYGNRKRLYGDYLYYQDKYLFNSDYQRWVDGTLDY
jgi:hypothetical protein